MCTWHLQHPPSRTIFPLHNSLKFSAAFKQYMNERKDRSVSNNDDAVHVLDKARHPQCTKSEESGERELLGCGVGDDDDSPTLNIVLCSYESE